MAKKDQDARYLMIIPHWDTDDYGDHRPNPGWRDEEVVFLTEKELDLNKLAKKYGIKKWASYDSEPGDFASWANKKHDDTAILLQIRAFNIKPIKVVTGWGFSKVPHEVSQNDN